MSNVFLVCCNSCSICRVGLDSPSTDATNWQSTRFGRSVQTRRQFGWLRIVFTRYASSELQFGALREEVVLYTCAQESKARIGRFLGGKVISYHSLCSSHEGQQGAANRQDSWDVFSGMYRALDGPPWTSVGYYS